MPVYRYKAITGAGEKVKGKMVAATAEGLMFNLEERGLFLLSYHEVRERKGIIRGRLKDKDLAEITANLAAMAEAGIPIAEAIMALAAEAPNRRISQALTEIHTQISEGASLAGAIGSYPHLFSDLYVRTVKVGEQTGNITGVFRQMVRFLEWKMRIRSDIRQALIYPIFLLVTIVAVLALLMTFVVPKFRTILTDLGIPLPGVTLFVLGVSDFFIHRWPVLIGIVAGIVVIVMAMDRHPKTRYIMDSLKLDIPVIGPFMRSIAISRFVKNLLISYRAGVDILTSFELIEKAVGNSRFERAVRSFKEKIQRGATLSDEVRQSGLFPRPVVLMIEVGERTGKLDELLERIGNFYDEEIPRGVKRVMSIMEPAFLLILAAIVLTVALAVILPIYQVSLSKMAG